VARELRSGLTRWVGAEGYRALLGRALQLSLPEYPVLGSFTANGGDLAEAAAAARLHGPAELAKGMVALVAAMTDLLGRIIGEEMAVRLIERMVIPETESGMESQGDRNG
jgi:hypothetical protein